MMSPNIYRLLYKSRARFDCDAADVDAFVDDIVTKAQKANAKRNVTGVLAHMDGTFIQVLEGPADAVEAVFERICRDTRHTDLQLVEFTANEARSFGGWAMAQFSTLSAGHPPIQKDFLASLPEQAVSDPDEAIRQLREALFEREARPAPHTSAFPHDFKHPGPPEARDAVAAAPSPPINGVPHRPDAIAPDRHRSSS